MQDPDKKKDNSGKIFLICLLSFFATFASVDAYFVYKAVVTHAGEVTDNPYEEGLAFDKTIKQAQLQDEMNIALSFAYQDGKAKLVMPTIEDATVKVSFVRPTHQGYDLTHDFIYKGEGRYEGDIDLPLEGLWRAQIEATWQDKTTQKMNSFKQVRDFVHQK